MKRKNLSILLLLFLSIHQASLTNSFDAIYAYLKVNITKDHIIKAAVVHAVVHLIYKSRGPRTDEKGNWLINGEIITPEERYNRVMKVPIFSTAFITGLPSYLLDITFGTESDWKDKQVQILYPLDENKKTQTTTVVTKGQCFATGSGAYCWYADNVLRHVSDVAKIGFGVLPIIITIKELAEKTTK
jgi:hypothetical protein